MKDTDIIKALELCQDSEECSNCPYGNFNVCIEEKDKNTLDLINRLQAELNKLKALKYHFDNLCGAGIEMLGIDQQGYAVSFDEYYKSILNEIESGS